MSHIRNLRNQKLQNNKFKLVNYHEEEKQPSQTFTPARRNQSDVRTRHVGGVRVGRGLAAQIRAQKR